MLTTFRLFYVLVFGGAHLGTDTKSTQPVQRDVNPVFNSLLVLDNVSDEDRLHFQIRDVGLIAKDRLGGLLGPRTIANATLAVGQSFEGFLELSPERQIPGNGPPLLEVKVRFALVPTMDVGLPTPGNTGLLVDAWSSGVPGAGPSSSQALQLNPEPSAPAIGMPSGSGVPVSGANAASSGGVFAAQAVPIVGSGLEVSVAEAAGGTPARWVSGAPVSGVASASSVFYIDSEVFALAPCNQILAKLFDMQDRRQTHPFPATAGRNYNALGAGFDFATKKHASLWSGVVDPLPADLDDVLDQMAKFNTLNSHPHWSSGVEVCLSWLTSVKDSIECAPQSIVFLMIIQTTLSFLLMI